MKNKQKRNRVILGPWLYVLTWTTIIILSANFRPSSKINIGNNCFGTPLYATRGEVMNMVENLERALHRPSSDAVKFALEKLCEGRPLPDREHMVREKLLRLYVLDGNHEVVDNELQVESGPSNWMAIILMVLGIAIFFQLFIDGEHGRLFFEKEAGWMEALNVYTSFFWSLVALCLMISLDLLNWRFLDSETYSWLNRLPVAGAIVWYAKSINSLIKAMKAC